MPVQSSILDSDFLGSSVFDLLVTTKKKLQLFAKKILDEDDSFDAFLRHMNSPDSIFHVHAEKVFNYLKDNYANSFCLRLAVLLSSKPHIPIRDVLIELLCRLLTSTKQPLWRKLTGMHRRQLESIFLECFKNEHSRAFLLKLRRVVCDIAREETKGNDWSELVDITLQSFGSNNESIVENGLLLYAYLAEGRFREGLVCRVDEIYKVLLKILDSESSSPVLKVAAFKASRAFVMCFTNASNQFLYQELLIEMIFSLFKATQKKENEDVNVLKQKQECAREMLDEFTELAWERPGFLKDHIELVIHCMFMLVEDTDVEEKARLSAVVFMVTIAERNMLVKLPKKNIKRLLFNIIVKLASITDLPSWDEAKNDKKNVGETMACAHAKKCLARLASALGGKIIMENYPDEYKTLLRSEDWQKRYAAVTSVAIIARSCSKSILASKIYLDHLVGIVLKAVEDVHPRVRWAAFIAVKEFCKHFSPYFQKYHEQVMRALSIAIKDFKHPRLQMRATVAMLFCNKNCSLDILKPYLEGIIHNLLIYLQTGKDYLQEVALAAIASIASTAKDQFQEYYGIVMPYLKVIMSNAAQELDRKLLGGCVNCITTIWVAVGKEKSMNDLHLVTEVLISYESVDEMGDPLRIHMLQAWGRLCRCLGQDFLPYLGVAIPSMLQSAQLDACISKPKGADNTENDESSVGSEVENKQLESNILEEKATACQMLCCCAAVLKESFFLWIHEVAKALVPLLQFEVHEDIRTTAVSAMPVLLHSFKLAIQKEYIRGYTESPLQKLSASILPALVEALHKEPEKAICGKILDSLNECIKLSGPNLEKAQAGNFMDKMVVILRATKAKLADRELNRVKNPDAEEQENLEENEPMEHVYSKASDCLATFINTYKSSVSPFFDKLLFCIGFMWDNNSTIVERRIASRIFHAVMEQCGEEAFRYYESNLPFLFKASHNEDQEVKKVVCWAIACCAQFGGSVFKPHIKEALSCLNDVIGHPKASEKDYVLAHEVAILALGKIYQFHSRAINAAEVLSGWLSHLPITNDLNVAKVVHEQLCIMVERSDKDLIGENRDNLPKIVEVLIEILWAGNNVATAETAKRITTQLKHFQETLPPSTWTSIQSSLEPRLYNFLKYILVQRI